MIRDDAPLPLAMLIFGSSAAMVYFCVKMFFPLVTRLVFEKDSLKIHTLGKKKPSMYAHEQCSMGYSQSRGIYLQVILVAEGKNYPLFFSQANIELLQEVLKKSQPATNNT